MFPIFNFPFLRTFPFIFDSKKLTFSSIEIKIFSFTGFENILKDELVNSETDKELQAVSFATKLDNGKIEDFEIIPYDEYLEFRKYTKNALLPPPHPPATHEEGVPFSAIETVGLHYIPEAE